VVGETQLLGYNWGTDPLKKRFAVSRKRFCAMRHEDAIGRWGVYFGRPSGSSASL